MSFDGRVYPKFIFEIATLKACGSLGQLHGYQDVYSFNHRSKSSLKIMSYIFRSMLPTGFERGKDRALVVVPDYCR